ncbi:MAG: hypothetical protein F8N37_06975 [Telmatospirillum sp.]|nr:hypothetical protein [Telmatospirillum sp.]
MRILSTSQHCLMALAVGFGLAACDQFSNTPEAARPVTVALPPEQPPPDKVIPPPPPKPPVPSRPVRTPPPSPDELIGLDETAVRSLLGSGGTSTDDGTAHILTYKKKICQIDILFFMDVKSAGLRVLSYEITPHAKTKLCYARLRKPHEAPVHEPPPHDQAAHEASP